MKEMARYGFILALICLIAAGLLSAVNLLTNPKILAQAQAEEMSSLKEVMPGAIEFKAVESGSEVLYYKAYGQNNSFMGVVFKASGKGYSSVVETIVGMLKDGTITAIKVLSQNETPGLGARVTEPSFTGQFKQINISGLDSVSAVTGATISSRAVINSVMLKAKEIQGQIQE